VGCFTKCPMADDHEDRPALFAKAAEVDAKLVYLANPDTTWAELARRNTSSPARALGFAARMACCARRGLWSIAPHGTAPETCLPMIRGLNRMRTLFQAHGLGRGAGSAMPSLRRI